MIEQPLPPAPPGGDDDDPGDTCDCHNDDCSICTALDAFIEQEDRPQPPTQDKPGDDRPIGIQRSHPAHVAALREGFSLVINHISEQADPEIGLCAADIVMALEQHLMATAVNIIQGKLETNPGAAYVNKMQLTQLLQHMQDQIQSWPVPEPVKH